MHTRRRPARTLAGRARTPQHAVVALVGGQAPHHDHVAGPSPSGAAATLAQRSSSSRTAPRAPSRAPAARCSSAFERGVRHRDAGRGGRTPALDRTTRDWTQRRAVVPEVRGVMCGTEELGLWAALGIGISAGDHAEYGSHDGHFGPGSKRTAARSIAHLRGRSARRGRRRRTRRPTAAVRTPAPCSASRRLYGPTPPRPVAVGHSSSWRPTSSRATRRSSLCMLLTRARIEPRLATLASNRSLGAGAAAAGA